MSSVKIEVKGLAELTEQLRQLGSLAGQKVLVAATRAAMKPVEETAKLLAPHRSGALEDAIQVASVKPRTGSVVCASGLTVTDKIRDRLDIVDDDGNATGKLSAARAGAASRWHFAEFGTSKAPAHPYIRPAWDHHRSELIAIMKAKMQAVIERARKRQIKDASG